MNVFSTDAFLESLAEAHFARRRWEIADFSLGSSVYRLLAVNGRPISDWPFFDFVEPRSADAPPKGRVRPLAYLPRAAVGRVPALGEKPASVAVGQQVAPLVDWTTFPTWAAFEKHVGERRGRLLSDSAKRERKLATEVGEVTYAFDEPSDEIFDQTVAWKSAQYIATGGTDAFFRENLVLFQALRRRGVLVMSGVRAAGRLLATAWSARDGLRLSYWVPAYDPTFASYSPGRLLLHRVLAESQRQGFRELDLLIGDEGYKWHYASHTRVIDSVGRPPMKKRLRQNLRRVLARYPRVLDAARELKRRLQH